MQIAGAAFRSDQENALANFKNQVAEVLGQDQEELRKLSRTKVLHDYIRLKSEVKTNTPPVQSTGNSLTKDAAGPANVSSAVPAELRVRVASVLSSRSHFASIFVFDRKKHPLLVAEQQANDINQPIVFHTQDLLSQQRQPDDRAWTARAATVLNSSVTSGPFGTRLDCTVPVLAEKPDVDPPPAALLGELKLDPVFSEAAKGKKAAGGFASNSKRAPALFIVLVKPGKILYHSNVALKNQSVSDSMPYFQPVANQMLANENGSQSFAWPGGDKYSATYTRIPDLGVSVAVVSSYDQAVADARRVGMIGFAMSLLISVMAAWLLTLYFQRRARGIERVTAGVEAIAKGKLDHRIELLSSDDLRPLADNVGLMSRQLSEQIAREAESRQFESFVRLSAVLTHDLKNAIEALSLTVSNMERHFDNQEFRADAMKTLRGATENLRSLVSRLSNPVTTLSGEHKRPQPVDLVPMLRRMISMIAEPARGEHEIKLNLPESLFALVDVERMNKVVENLIINALEAMAGKSGTLTIEAGTRDDGKVFFSVSDTGEGMSPRFIEERLFHPFATTKKRGVGLGLYTCREVVRANGGAIEVNSQEGAGTTFRVVLPSAAIDRRGEK